VTLTRTDIRDGASQSLTENPSSIFRLFPDHAEMIHFSSWLGFVPAIHVFLLKRRKNVDARHRRQVYAVCASLTAMAGHDELRLRAPFHWLLF
jgi:hypothetical protein